MRRHFRPLLRVWALLSALSLVCSAVLAAQAKAASERALFGLADHMMRFAGALHQTTPVELKLNGASFFLSNATVPAPVGEVLDRFAAKCAEKNGQIGRAWADEAALAGRTLSGLSGVDEASGVLDGVLRQEVDGAGYVVCFEAPDGSTLAPSELVARFERFIQSGDVADVGHLRYVRVTRAQSRADHSFFVAVWTEGALPIYEMFPEHGDAPGRDPIGLTRPSDARRILSSEQPGRDVLVTMYQSAAATRADLQRFYTSMLQERGYALLDSHDAMSEQLIIAKNERANQLITVAFAEDEAGKGIATLSTRPD
jgi:hypothetical protein